MRVVFQHPEFADSLSLKIHLKMLLETQRVWHWLKNPSPKSPSSFTSKNSGDSTGLTEEQEHEDNRFEQILAQQ